MTQQNIYYELTKQRTDQSMHSKMEELDPQAKQWLQNILGIEFRVSKHIHSHQDEVYKIETPLNGYYLLISELPGKNLVELIGEWSEIDIVEKFAEAIRQLHSIDATKVFPQAHPKDVLLHGDMAQV